MTVIQQKNLTDWLFKQAPVIVLLVGTNIAQYRYFTAQMDKMEAKYEGKIDKLENKIEHLEDKLFLKKYSYNNINKIKI